MEPTIETAEIETTDEIEISDLLEGMRCPECGHTEPFEIEVLTLCTVFNDGSDDPGQHMDWDNESYCRCPNCNSEGIVADFKVAAVKAD